MRADERPVIRIKPILLVFQEIRNVLQHAGHAIDCEWPTPSSVRGADEDASRCGGEGLHIFSETAERSALKQVHLDIGRIEDIDGVGVIPQIACNRFQRFRARKIAAYRNDAVFLVQSADEFEIRGAGQVIARLPFGIDLFDQLPHGWHGESASAGRPEPEGDIEAIRIKRSGCIRQ